jgi:hypothetical protein
VFRDCTALRAEVRTGPMKRRRTIERLSRIPGMMPSSFRWQKWHLQIRLERKPFSIEEWLT